LRTKVEEKVPGDSGQVGARGEESIDGAANLRIVPDVGFKRLHPSVIEAESCLIPRRTAGHGAGGRV